MPAARSHFAMATVNGNILASGGENVNRTLDILERYDTCTDFSSTKTPSPVTFSRAAAGVVNGKVYVIGSGLTLEHDPSNDIR